MTIKALLNKKKPEFEKILAFFKNEIATIRTGRDNPSLVEDIEVSYFDQLLRVKELASITAPEPRLIVIQPWDQNVTEAIAGAIRKSDLGLNPTVDGTVIRLNIPPLTEERRREFIKILKQKTEETKIKFRRAREELWDRVQKMEREHQIREDDKFKARDELQKLIDEYNKKAEELEKKKEGELLN